MDQQKILSLAATLAEHLALVARGIAIHGAAGGDLSEQNAKQLLQLVRAADRFASGL